MKSHWYFVSWILNFLQCIDRPAVRVWLEQGWRILKLLPSIDSSASGVTRAGLSVLRGWGPLSLEPDLEEVFGVLKCFPGVLITGSGCLLDSGVVDPWDDTYNFNSSRGCQDDRVRTCSNWLKCFFFPLIFNPYLISWMIGWTQLPKGMDVLSKVSQVIWQKTFTGPAGVRTSQFS